mmetsp:Transcript_105642/g.186770  ORF Transcript_105642/g.186770 Transcript_105642/m.186770 type:complete len:448 (-) Transcript_105642:22-1365(-)
MGDHTAVLAEDSRASCVNVLELEEQLLQSARAGQLLLERNQTSEAEVTRLSDVVADLELKVERLNEDLVKAREQDHRQMYDEEIRHLGDTLAVLEQKNESLQEELRQSWRQHDESENRLREELHNLKASHTQLESEHIAQGEAHEEECNRLRARCRSLLEREGSLQAMLDESRRQEHDLKDEVAALKARHDLSSLNDTLPASGKAACMSAGNDEEHPLESKVTELESQLRSLKQENRDLHCQVDELQLKVEEAAQDVEELHQALVHTEGQCQVLEEKALEAHGLLDNAKCEFQAQCLHAHKLPEAQEKDSITQALRYSQQAPRYSQPSQGKPWFSLSKLGLLSQPSKSTTITGGARQKGTSIKALVSKHFRTLKNDADLDNVSTSDSEAETDSKSKKAHEMHNASQAKGKSKISQEEDHLKMRARLRLRGGVQRKDCTLPGHDMMAV